jgi:hypothetical protein
MLFLLGTGLFCCRAPTLAKHTSRKRRHVIITILAWLLVKRRLRPTQQVVHLVSLPDGGGETKSAAGAVVLKVF